MCTSNRSAGRVLGRRAVALTTALAITLAACSSNSASSWCDEASKVVTLVGDYREFTELPEAGDFRDRIRDAVDRRDFVVEVAEGEAVAAFAAIGVGLVNVDRVLSEYGYDLLRAQSESDTEEQDDLYALDGVPMENALSVAEAHVALRCSST